MEQPLPIDQLDRFPRRWSLGPLETMPRCGMEEDGECRNGMLDFGTTCHLVERLWGFGWVGGRGNMAGGPLGERHTNPFFFFKGRRDILPPSYNINIFRFSQS